MKRIGLVTGFTIVELIVVITIIGVLATIVGLSYKNWQTSIITAQLKSDLNGAASAMENARTFGNEYPSTVPTTFTPSEGVTLTGGSTDGGETYCIDAVSSRDESIRYYIDSLSGTDGAKQGICGSLNLIATTASMTEIDVSWDAFVDATSYTLQRDTNSSFPNPTIVTQTGITYLSSGLSIGTTYYYRVNVTIAGNTSDWSDTVSATTTINTPSAPTVTANTVAATTTWSWPAVTCASGTTARYQYKYTITPAGYDSGWVTPTNPEALSIGFTTLTENQTYTVQVQAQCYTTYTTSTWSASGQESYFRPITTYTLTIIAGSGGTVNTAVNGTYNTGSTPTITATPSTYYSFSSWTGSTGCSGVASHTITMDANKSCTANFTITAIAAPATPGVTANTAGATTTWSWGAASCPGNTATYQYLYTISPSGYNSGWVAIDSTAVAFTTSTEGQTYTVQVQARCYNAVTTSGWSASGSANYYRIITYTLTISTGTGGTVNTAVNGTYNTGSTPTITAAPNSYYAFANWTGSTGCSGVASHTITMDANKSCTASFTDVNTGDVFYYLKTLATGYTTIAATYASIDLEMYVIGSQVISANTSWGDGTADARMLGVRVEGNLTVNAGVTLTATTRKRGMVIYVTGDLILNGTISMTARGAIAAGQRVLLLNRGAAYEVAAAGGAGAPQGGSWSLGWAANDGYTGTSGAATGASGGGGSGGSGCYHPNVYGYGVNTGTGGAGTSYSGGAGSGGHTKGENQGSGTTDNGGANGGAGSAGSAGFGSAGGGAGNNGGAGSGSVGVVGSNGTGGLLVLYVNGTLSVAAFGYGTLSSTGSVGGTANSSSGAVGSGGGSGGGHVDYFYRTLSGSPIITVTGGVGGQAWSGGGHTGSGGAGGAGSSRAAQSNF